MDGFGAGSLVVIAWNIYRSCRAAPESFGSIESEVLAFRAVLEEAQETVFAHPLSAAQQERLKDVVGGCRRVLEDLQALVTRYERLGTQERRSWDRFGWATNDITELRARLTANATILNSWISISQANVKKKLDNFLREFQEGKRQDSVISVQTLDSLNKDEREIWRTIRKELEEIGITVAAFEANKEFVFGWFTEALKRGAFEEQPSKGQIFEEPIQLSTDGSHARTRKRPSSHGTEVTAMYSASQEKPGRPNTAFTWPPPNICVNKDNSHKPGARLAWLIAFLTRPNDRIKSAINEGNVSEVREILTNENKVYWLSKASLSAAMSFVASRGDEEVVRILIKKGADVNGGERQEATPLQIAARNGHATVVKLLLEEGADVHSSNGTHGTALQLALEFGQVEVVEVLLQYSASFNDGHLNLDTALELASRYGHERIVRLLLKKGADPKRRESTALHEASANGHEHIVRLLLRKGVNVNTVSIFGQTALQCASEQGHERVVRLLLHKGADVKTASTYGRTALKCAAENGHEEIVHLLLEKRAEVTPDVLSSALKRKHYGVARLLTSISMTEAFDGDSSLSLGAAS